MFVCLQVWLQCLFGLFGYLCICSFCVFAFVRLCGCLSACVQVCLCVCWRVLVYVLLFACFFDGVGSCVCVWWFV